MTSRVLAIDFGSSYCRMAIADSGRPLAIQNAEGLDAIPNAVLIDEGQVIVGRPALLQAVVRPDQVVRWIPRLLGDEHVCIQGFSAMNLAAAVFRALKTEAETFLGEPVATCVLTYPACFSTRASEILRQAAEQAGFEVRNLIAAPVAACWHENALERLQQGQRFLVVSLGGGILDIAVVSLRNGVLHTEAAGGDPRLGGEDWTRALADFAAEQCEAALGEDPRNNLGDSDRLYEQCEQAKHDLSHLQTVSFPCAAGPRRTEITLSREAFEARTEWLTQAAVERVHITLERAGLDWNAMDQVLFVGGASRMPGLRGALERASQKTLLQMRAPDLAVVYGAAMFAAGERARAQQAGALRLAVQRSTARAVGIRTVDYENNPPRLKNLALIPANAALPASACREFVLSPHAQESFEITFGEFAADDDFDFIARLRFRCPPGARQGDVIRLNLHYDLSGLPRLEAVHLNSGMVLHSDRLPEAAEPLQAAPSHPPPDRRGSPELPGGVVDRVHFAVTSPLEVVPAMPFVIDVWAHLEQQRAEVLERAREELGEAFRIKSKGPVQVRRGTTLTVRLKVEDLEVDPPEDTIFWEGEVGNASFAVRVPETAALGERRGLVTIHVAGLQIARLNFLVLVGRTAGASGNRYVKEERHGQAFLSYASEDRDRVLARVQGIQKAAPGLQFFFDVLSLRSGQDWEKELWRVIPQQDVFYLFWSAHAKASPWVEKEWRCGLESRGLSFIDPVPLVSPETVPPPPELASRHFNDWMLAFMENP